MERIWLKQYPAGVPADIDVSQYPSLVELLEESFAKFRRPQGVHLHGQVDHLSRARRDVGGARRLSAEQGPRRRAPASR